MTYTISKEIARQFIVTYQHLTDASAIKDDEMLLSYIQKVGCLQFDPLQVVGKNVDLVIQSRYPKYREDAVYHYLYEDVQLLDIWDKNMAISHISDWPYFAKNREKSERRFTEHREYETEILEHMTSVPHLKPADLPYDEKVNWGYGSGRKATAAMDILFYCGKAIVHHKEGTRKFYCLPETRLPEELLIAAPPYQNDAEYFEQFVLRRVRSVGLLWNKTSDVFLNWIKMPTVERNAAFKRLLQKGIIREVIIADVPEPFYIATEDFSLLQTVEQTQFENQKAARIIAALDNIMWDRKLIATLFDFTYKWEVYTPAAKRTYGYYVLPVLYGTGMIGRIELRFNRKAGILDVHNFWWEERYNKTEQRRLRGKVRKAIQQFAKFIEADEIDYLLDRNILDNNMKVTVFKK